MAARLLTVLGNDGAGKNTLVGSLIYKCGLGLPQLEELKREGIQQYEEIVPFYEMKGRAQCFYTPSGLLSVEERQNPDLAFWVVDASDATSWETSVQNMSSAVSSGALQPRVKLIILVNKMDAAAWSRQTFDVVVRMFSKAHLNARAYIIPTSGLRGENILETPKDGSWVKDMAAGHSKGSISVSGEPLMSLLG